jgi:DNA-binding MarR family transcriptional regulator
MHGGGARPSWPIYRQSEIVRPYSGTMENGRIYRHPGHLIRRAQQIAVSIFTDHCRAHGATSVQYGILYTVGHNPGIDQISLANLIALDRSNTGEVVGRLEERGLLRRASGNVDRRTKRLYLTPAGAELVEEMTPDVERAQERMMAPLSEEERETLTALLEKFVDINNAFSRAPERPVVVRKAS